MVRDNNELRAYLTNLVVEDVKDPDTPGLKKVTYSYDDRKRKYEGFFHIEDVVNNRLIVKVEEGNLVKGLICVHPVVVGSFYGKVNGGFREIDGILVDVNDLRFNEAIQPEPVFQSYKNRRVA